MVVINGENAANGFGITKKIYDQFLQAGADVVTTGDHLFDQREILLQMDQCERLVRPANLPQKIPGAGAKILTLDNGKKILTIQLLGQLFLKITPDNPFEAVENILQSYQLGKNVDAIVVDVHGEASSERMAMGHFLDGRVSLVTGSHTHVPTADTQILPRGTGYHTDAGMCGDYDSVIGFDKQISLTGFLNKFRADRLTPANGEATLCGTFVETDDKTGLARSISMVRVGGRLQPSEPVLA